jgi:leucyl-tRNA synthetase
MFMGPFEETITWDAKGVKGARRFLEKVWLLVTSKCKNKNSKLKSGTKNNNKNLDKLLHKTIKKVGEDIENLRFNTAISALMILVNEMSNHFIVNLQQLKNLLLILAPFAPHITEELWHNLGAKNSIHIQSWPKYDEKLIKEETFTLIIQINGKIRDKIEAKADISEKEAKELALSSEKIKKWIAGQEIKKTIFIPRKLINIVL